MQTQCTGSAIKYRLTISVMQASISVDYDDKIAKVTNGAFEVYLSPAGRCS